MIVVQFFKADGLSSLCNHFKLVEAFLCSYFLEGRVRRLSASGQLRYHSHVQCFLCWDAGGLSQAVRAGWWAALLQYPDQRSCGFAEFSHQTAAFSWQRACLGCLGD